ncbi:MAG: hypothetical protein GXO24_03990, partial [Chlorobi bacterium]|nr:hypothetical protein [Chlorobiota bacterium]
MKKILFIVLILPVFVLSAQYKGYKPALEPYVKFLQSREFPTAKEYILEKFKTKDIVIISERDHRDLS